jgi:hypothetical protein
VIKGAAPNRDRSICLCNDSLGKLINGYRFHRLSAATRAISLRSYGVVAFKRVLAPAKPLARLAGCLDSVSSISPVAVRAICTALPITSAGRFCPFGPCGIVQLPTALRRVPGLHGRHHHRPGRKPWHFSVGL